MSLKIRTIISTSLSCCSSAHKIRRSRLRTTSSWRTGHFQIVTSGLWLRHMFPRQIPELYEHIWQLCIQFPNNNPSRQSRLFATHGIYYFYAAPVFDGVVYLLGPRTFKPKQIFPIYLELTQGLVLFIHELSRRYHYGTRFTAPGINKQQMVYKIAARFKVDNRSSCFGTCFFTVYQELPRSLKGKHLTDICIAD